MIMLNLFARKFEITASVMSDVGNVRTNNEDNYYLNGKYRADVNINRSKEDIHINEKHCLFAVCDGMGGEEYGELASLIAVQSLGFDIGGNMRINATDNLRQINRMVDMKRRELKCRNMGSTIAALAINERRAIAFNVGDSRVYLYRDRSLSQLSKDHNETPSLVVDGLMRREESGSHILTQYLGVPEDDFIIEPYFSEEIKIKVGDIFLICSDGVTDMMPDTRITEILSKEKSCLAISKAITEVSKEMGGRDNITVLAITVNLAR